MRNIEIVRGYRSFGHEDVYPGNPDLELLDGDIITAEGEKATLTDAHQEVGIVIQPTNLGNTEYREASGKVPVYVSNFTVRTTRFHPATFKVGDGVSVKDGLPVLADDTNKEIWGYVTAVGNGGASIDIRVNN